MTVSIRRYAPKDLEACRGLWRALTQRHRDIYADPTIGGDEPGAHFDGFLLHPKLAAAWVAEEESAVVGLVGLLVDGNEAEVEPVVVADSHRSQGVGRRLIECAAEEAKRREVAILNIRPVARNVEAMRLFHELGFDILGRIEMFRVLKPSGKAAWKEGIDLHGERYRY